MTLCLYSPSFRILWAWVCSFTSSTPRSPVQVGLNLLLLRSVSSQSSIASDFHMIDRAHFCRFAAMPVMPLVSEVPGDIQSTGRTAMLMHACTGRIPPQTAAEMISDCLNICKVQQADCFRVCAGLSLKTQECSAIFLGVRLFCRYVQRGADARQRAFFCSRRLCCIFLRGWLTAIVGTACFLRPLSR